LQLYKELSAVSFTSEVKQTQDEVVELITKYLLFVYNKISST